MLRISGAPAPVGSGQHPLLPQRSMAAAQFLQVNQGEDTRFVWSLPESSILPLPNQRFYVATVHEKSSSPKRTQDLCWRPYFLTRSAPSSALISCSMKLGRQEDR